MMIKIVNKKTHKPTPDDIYIGRGSIMGNPYHSKESNHPQALYKVETDDEAIDGYRTYFEDRYKNDDLFRNTILELVNRELDDKNTNFVCYCAPNKCHGDVIKEFIDEITIQIRWPSFM